VIFVICINNFRTNNHIIQLCSGPTGFFLNKRIRLFIQGKVRNNYFEIASFISSCQWQTICHTWVY